MKIAKTQSNSNYKNKTSFKGLIPTERLKELASKNTPEARKMLHSCLGFNAVYRGAQDLNPDRISREMADKFHINTEFGNNPIVAAFSALTANIFHKLGFAQPTNVLLKNFDGTRYKKMLGVCATNPYDDELYRKFGKDFPLRSVILNEAVNWYNIQEQMMHLKNLRHSSTGHFLSPCIHEFVHSAHLDNLIKKYGNGSKIMQKFQRDFKNEATISLIKKETGNYGATKPCEMVAEEMTELIVDSLNPKTIMPDEIIFKMQRAKEPFQMDVLIDACWRGDVTQIELFRKKNITIIERIKKLYG